MDKPVALRFEVEHQHPITLIQQEDGFFAVQYGAERTSNMDYNEAALELGLAMLHALACEGKINA